MSATVSESESLSPVKAVEEIRRIGSLHGALARRTAGLTWMIWGVVAPAIFVTYSLAGLVVAQDPAAARLFPLLWIPWAALGLLTTASLWRSVGLVIPVDRTRGARQGIVTGIVIVGFIAAGIVTIDFMGAPISEPAWALMGLGLAALAVGILGLNSYDATDRRAWIAAGAIMALTALAGSLLLGGDVAAGRQWFTLISPLTSALVFFGGGLYLTTRA